MRYFLELSYKGTRYAGFQVQDNALTIQEEVQKALLAFYRQPIQLTGSSRTDAGVHARQNYFHFDADITVAEKNIYNLNAILPPDVVIQRIFRVPDELHCRFHATHRTYKYFLYKKKDPFLADRAWFYPYAVDVDAMNQAAALLMTYSDFTSFSKRNTQVKTKLCTLTQSSWEVQGELLVYKVQGNRFLRGMVRGLVGTMLQVGRGKLSLDGLLAVIDAKDCSKADFTTPAHGLFLMEVGFDSIPVI